MRVADVFESIFGQAQVRDYLRTTLRTGRLSHAYLFTGLLVPTRPRQPMPLPKRSSVLIRAV